MNNQLIDYIIRIKNASLAKRKRVESPYSKITKQIGLILVKEGFLDSVELEKHDGKNTLVSHIKYQNKIPVLIGVEILSKPSSRMYIKSSKIQELEIKGRVLSVLSTSKGLMTGKNAVKSGLGGEVLIKIW